ncbi:MAG: CoA transferase [Syntrophales bacterium]|jgi:formyl-CoA transferase|nr:CoA transferase [Syntrophales bacterium]
MKSSDSKNGALMNLRVLDLTRVLAGPFCTMMLGDLGAEIIKIEVPGLGDDSRSYPPFIGTESAYFMNLNRNKRSMTIDLKTPEGKGVFLDLVKCSDVVIENFRPGTMEKMGLSYEELSKENPSIVYSSISGFGQYGPYRDLPGYDIIGQAMGGIMSVTGWPDGPPTRTGVAIADVLAGLCSGIGILSALLARNNINRGQHVDVSLVDSVVASMAAVIQIYLVEQREPQRVGNRYEFISPYGSFSAKNGWVVIGIGNDKLWREFCRAIGREDLLEVGDYQANVDRVKNDARVKQIVEEWTLQQNVKDIVDFLLKRKIPCAPIYGVKDIVEDEHIAKAREMIINVDHPKAGPMKMVGSPIKLSVTPAAVHTPAPLLGQHTDEILREVLSYPEETIQRLRQKNVF